MRPLTSAGCSSTYSMYQYKYTHHRPELKQLCNPINHSELTQTILQPPSIHYKICAEHWIDEDLGEQSCLWTHQVGQALIFVGSRHNSWSADELWFDQQMWTRPCLQYQAQLQQTVSEWWETLTEVSWSLTILLKLERKMSAGSVCAVKCRILKESS